MDRRYRGTAVRQTPSSSHADSRWNWPSCGRAQARLWQDRWQSSSKSRAAAGAGTGPTGWPIGPARGRNRNNRCWWAWARAAVCRGCPQRRAGPRSTWRQRLQWRQTAVALGPPDAAGRRQATRRRMPRASRLAAFARSRLRGPVRRGLVGIGIEFAQTLHDVRIGHEGFPQQTGPIVFDHGHNRRLV